MENDSLALAAPATEAARPLIVIDWAAIPGWVPVVIGAVIAASGAVVTAFMAARSALRIRVVDALKEENHRAQEWSTVVLEALGDYLESERRFHFERGKGDQAHKSSWERIVGMSRGRVDRAAQDRMEQISACLKQARQCRQFGPIEDAQDYWDVAAHHHQPQLATALEKQSLRTKAAVVDAMAARMVRKHIVGWGLSIRKRDERLTDVYRTRDALQRIDPDQS